MSNEASFKMTINGTPIPQGRPKASAFNGHIKMYDPLASRNWKSRVSYYAQQSMLEDKREMFKDGVALKLTAVFYLPIPASWSNKKKASAMSCSVLPTSKPDLSNLLKGIEDAMNGIVYQDDKNIVVETLGKFYSDVPRTEITVEEYCGDFWF